MRITQDPTMTDTPCDHRHAVALFRYGLIAELLQIPPGSGRLQQRLEDKAAQEYTIPGTRRRRVAAETLRDWLKRYRKGGFDALLPKPRADRGRPRSDSRRGTAAGRDRASLARPPRADGPA
jgi:hypothetical protein